MNWKVKTIFAIYLLDIVNIRVSLLTNHSLNHNFLFTIGYSNFQITVYSWFYPVHFPDLITTYTMLTHTQVRYHYQVLHIIKLSRSTHCKTSRDVPIPQWNLEILKSQNFHVSDAIPVWVNSLTF